MPEEADGTDLASRESRSLQHREVLVVDPRPAQESVGSYRPHLFQQERRGAGDEVCSFGQLALAEGYIVRYVGEALIVLRAVIHHQAGLQVRKQIQRSPGWEVGYYHRRNTFQETPEVPHDARHEDRAVEVAKGFPRGRSHER